MSAASDFIFVFIGLTAIERLIEVRVSNRNAQWSLDQGGTEYGQSHYPFMVVLHTVFYSPASVKSGSQTPRLSLHWGSQPR